MATDIQEKQAVLRDSKGRMLKPLPGGAPPITTETARSMVQKRWNNYRRAAVKRIVGEASSIDPSVSTGADAFGLVAAKQYSALMDSEKPVIGDLEKLQKIMTGMVANSERENVAAPSQISATPSAMRELLAQIEAEIAARVQRAQAVDGVVAEADNAE